MDESAILTTITEQYRQAASGWYRHLFEMAVGLFGLLAIIELAWTGVWWAFAKKDIESIWTEFLKKIMVILFFYWILQNAHVFMPAILQSFIMIGADASGVKTLDPSAVLAQGVQIAANVLQPLSLIGLVSSPAASLVGAFTWLIVIICFALIAATLVVTLIEAYVVMGAGILLLGFSSNEFTRQYAMSYLTYTINVGVKLFVLYLVIGVGSSLAASWGDLLLHSGGKGSEAFLLVIAASIVYLYVVLSIPQKAASLISGSSSASSGGLLGSAAAVGVASLGAGKMAARGAMGAGRTAFESVQQARAGSQMHGGGLKGALSGTALAAKNLGGAVMGRLSGFDASVSGAMKSRSSELNAVSATTRPRSPQPPNGNTPNPKAGSGLGAATMHAAKQAQTHSEETSTATPPGQKGS